MKSDRLDQIKQQLVDQACDISDEYDVIYALEQMGYRRTDAVKIFKQLNGEDITAASDVIDDGVDVIEV